MVKCNFKRKVTKGAYSLYEHKDSNETHHYECSCAAGPHFQMDCAGEDCIFQQQLKLLREIWTELKIQKGALFRCPKCNKTVKGIDWMIEHNLCRDCWLKKEK